MLVITLTNCPSKLRGDLTKWLFEIDTGVFVGNLNARVRDGIWERICENIKNGRATMVFSSNNEQKLDFRIHNADWEPIDYDGIKLVLRRYPDKEKPTDVKISKFEQQHMNRLLQRKKKPLYGQENYVVIDIETTGLQDSDQIIEIGALRIEGGKIKERFSVLLKNEKPLPQKIIELTGITDEILAQDGISTKEAIEDFRKFCGESELVGHNVQFDLRFLQSAFIKHGISMMRNNTIDTMRIARKNIDCIEGYDLETLAKFFSIEYYNLHRVLDDCLLTYKIFEKLKEF